MSGPVPWRPTYGVDYRVGIPTKVAHKASMHYYGGLWTVCGASTCTLCARHKYAEKRYCLPVIVYTGTEWKYAVVKKWDLDQLTSKVIGRIYKSTPGVDLLIKNDPSSGLRITACTDSLLPTRRDADHLRADLESLLPTLPDWEGYTPPKPPPLTRMRLLRS